MTFGVQSQRDIAGNEKAGIFLRFRRDSSGSALIEYSIIAFPFLILIFAIFEVGLLYWADLELENATNDAARLVLTGNAPPTREEMRIAICSKTAVLNRCETDLRVELRAFANFEAIQQSQPLDIDNNLKNLSDFDYDIVVGNQVVQISTFYEWRLLNAVPFGSFSNMANNNRLLRTTVVTQTEPF